MANVPYSYRSDPAVPKFDDTHPLIIFDGLCVLCSTGVHFMLKHDARGTSRFAAIQNPIPRALYAHYNLNAETFDTFMVLRNGLPHIKWRGFVAAGKTMGGIWRALATLGHIIPTPLGDKIYDVIQRNRLNWFGTRQTCLLPTPAQRHRFL